MSFETFPKERFGLVTGSKCSVMFPLRGDGVVGMTTYAKQLANERFFQFYDEMNSRATDHGKMAEHFAALHYREHYDDSLQEGGWYRNGECGGSTDGETTTKVIDFKCPVTLEGWLYFLYNKLDKKFIKQ